MPEIILVMIRFLLICRQPPPTILFQFFFFFEKPIRFQLWLLPPPISLPETFESMAQQAKYADLHSLFLEITSIPLMRWHSKIRRPKDMIQTLT